MHSLTNRLRMLASLWVAYIFVAPGALGQAPQPERGDLLIRNATVLTVTNGTHENTDILVSNGRIARIGQGLSAPGGVRVIDAAGQYVMPGIIDAHSHIAITNVNEATNPITAEVQIRDVINPFDVNIYRALAGGVTSIHAMHGSANVIGGQCQSLKLRYGVTDPGDLIFEGAPRTIKFALGENPTRVHGRGANVQPLSRMGVENVIREGFTKALRYAEAWEAYENRRRTDRRAVPPAYDQRLEVLRDILRGDILIQAHSYRSDEILMLMDVARGFGIDRLTFHHGNEAYKVAPELAEFGAGASVFMDWWAYKFEVYYSTASNSAILARNGVRTSLNSDSPEVIRHLYHEAAKTKKYGDLTDNEALALITINPAWQLGIDGRVGSIEVGKDADLAIFSAHPLSVYAVPQMTIVDGIVRFDRAEDPDDMRIHVDPTAEIDEVLLWEENHDRCMQETQHVLEFLGHGHAH